MKTKIKGRFVYHKCHPHDKHWYRLLWDISNREDNTMECAGCRIKIPQSNHYLVLWRQRTWLDLELPSSIVNKIK